MVIPNFSERCYAESTRDAIFLFQRRVLNVVGMPEGWEWEDGAFEKVREEGDSDDEPESMSILEAFEQELFCEDSACDLPCVIDHWETDRVFLSREEATAYGEAKHYNYRDGWRVYSVCAEGELAKLLKDT